VDDATPEAIVADLNRLADELDVLADDANKKLGAPYATETDRFYLVGRLSAFMQARMKVDSLVLTIKFRARLG
jgi:hypothetical protein